MIRSLWMVCSLVLAGSAVASVNPTEMVDVSRGGPAQVELRQDTAPTVADLAAHLRSEGYGPVDEAHLARSIARGESYLSPCSHREAACRTLAYAPPVQTKRALDPNSLTTSGVMSQATPSAPRLAAPAPTGSSGSSSFSDFVPLLVGILQLFLGMSMGGANTGYAGNPGYPGYNGFTGSNSTPGLGGVYTASSRNTGGGIYGTGPAHAPHPRSGISSGFGPGEISQATPSNGQSFFQNLPLRQGSFDVGPNGHFWDCRGSSCHRPHHGNDLHAAHGTPVYAVASGTVKRIKHDEDGYDWYIIIEHDATTTVRFAANSQRTMNYNTLYAHIAVANGLTEGARVEAGQVIATVNREGVSSPHCHFEVLVDDGSWKGVPLNPDAFADFHPDGERGTNGVYASREPQLGRGLV